MSMRLPVWIKSQCRKIVFFEVCTITSLIMLILINVWVREARCHHERCIFHAPWKISLLRILGYTAGSTSCLPSDSFHCHFKPRYNHIIHCCQNRIMKHILHASKDVINLFSNSVDEIPYKDLFMTCTTVAKWCTAEIVNKITVLGRTLLVYPHPLSLGAQYRKQNRSKNHLPDCGAFCSGAYFPRGKHVCINN